MNGTTLLSIAFTLALAGLVHGAVHQIPLRRVAVPPEIHQHLVPKEYRDLLQRHEEAMKVVRSQFHVAATASALNVTLQSYVVAVGNISVGTPPQSFSLRIDPFADQLYVIGAGAEYTSWYFSSDNPVTDKNLFQPNASSSYEDNGDADFVDNDQYLDGTLGTDVVQIGPSLSANLSINIANLVSFWTKNNDIDGTLGLSNRRSSDDTPTVLEQLLPSLSQPVITVQINHTGPYDAEGSGVVEFGGLAPRVCQNDWLQLNSGSSDDYWSSIVPSFNITAVSGPASDGSCQSHVNANITVYLIDLPIPLLVSYQVQELIVQASGAQWDSSTGWYKVVDSASAQPISLTLEGGQIQLNPENYIAEYDGTNYLSSYGYYDQHTYAGSWLALGQQFLDSRCLSQNINTGAWSLATAIKGSDLALSDGTNDGNSTQQSPGGTNSTDGGGSGGNNSTDGGGSGGNNSTDGGGSGGNNSTDGGGSGGNNSTDGGGSGGNNSTDGGGSGGNNSTDGGGSGGNNSTDGGGSGGNNSTDGGGSGGNNSTDGGGSGGTNSTDGGGSGGNNSTDGGGSGGNNSTDGGGSGGNNSTDGGGSGGNNSTDGGGSGGNNNTDGGGSGGNNSTDGGGSGGNNSTDGGGSGGNNSTDGGGSGGNNSTDGGGSGGNNSTDGGGSGGNNSTDGGGSGGNNSTDGGGSGGNNSTDGGGSGGNNSTDGGGSGGNNSTDGGGSGGNNSTDGGGSGGTNSTDGGGSGGTNSTDGGGSGGNNSIDGGGSGGNNSTDGGGSGGTNSTDGGGSGGNNSTDGGGSGGTNDGSSIGGGGSSNSSDGAPAMVLKKIGRNMLGVRLFNHL